MSLSLFRGSIVLLAIFSMGGCVPKTQYEDQQSKLVDAQEKLRSLEASTVDCDKDMFLQLKEQAQALDLLTQELVERNTDLSKEVARLKVSESQGRAEDEACGRKLNAQSADYEGKIQRTRDTYEDLIKQLKDEVAKLRETLEKTKVSSSSGSKGKSKSGSKAESKK